MRLLPQTRPRCPSKLRIPAHIIPFRFLEAYILSVGYHAAAQGEIFRQTYYFIPFEEDIRLQMTARLNYFLRCRNDKNVYIYPDIHLVTKETTL
jgi:hypothetical protein